MAVCHLPLTNGGSTLVSEVDAHREFSVIAESGRLVRGVPIEMEWRWHRIKSDQVYAESGSGASRVRLHRLLMQPPPAVFVDHRDCDGLNNTRGNLRLSTNAQNQHNARRRSDNTTGFKGVSFYHSRFHARIKSGGRLVYLGGFDTAEAAARAYDAAALEHFGEFARLNFPDSMGAPGPLPTNILRSSTP